jgi:hypothetical protein
MKYYYQLLSNSYQDVLFFFVPFRSRKKKRKRDISNKREGKASENLSFPYMRWWSSIIEWVRHVLVLAPLRALYLKGPSVGEYGFWGGAAPDDICAALTGSPSSFWRTSPLECERLIDARFESFEVSLFSVLYIYGACKICSFFWYKYVIMQGIVFPQLDRLSMCHQRMLRLRNCQCHLYPWAGTPIPYASDANTQGIHKTP